jgi:sugar phosphate isomerase/epimerase
VQGDDDAARRGFEESLELARRVGEDELVVGELTNLGSVETRAGNLERALALCREALTLAIELGSAYAIPYCVVNLGGVASARADHEDAARILGAGKAMFDRTGAAIDPGTAIEFHRHVERTRAALDPGFEPAWERGYELDDEQAVAEALAYRM